METRQRTAILVVGPLPPPVHGMSLVTSRFVGRLRENFDVEVADISPGPSIRGPRYHLRKSIRVLRAASRVVRPTAARRGPLYLPSDGNWGMLYTALLAACARLARRPLTLHHHNYSYIARRDWRMAMVCLAAGPRTTHVVLCSKMEEDLRARYAGVRRTAVLGNATFIVAAAAEPRHHVGPIRIGHLGNLSPEKGVDRIVAVFERLVRDGVKVALRLAGPAVGEAAGWIRQLRNRHGDAVEHLGPIEEASKRSFYAGLDVFLFASRLSEAQPLVVLEAMAHGVPVIAQAGGCVPAMVSHGGGLSIDSEAAFVEIASARLLHWSRHRDDLARAGQAARDAFGHLVVESGAQLEALLSGLAESHGDR